MSQHYQRFVEQIDVFLHQNGKVGEVADKVEKMTGVKRVIFGQAILGLLGLYMIFGYFAQLICNFVGFVYPAYVSIKALESSSKDDDTRWLTYWVVYAFFSVVEFFSDFLLSWFPFYWLAKVVFLVWCYAPIQENGTFFVYNRVIRPFFLKNQSKIDSFGKKLDDKISKVASQHFCQTSIIEQKLESRFLYKRKL